MPKSRQPDETARHIKCVEFHAQEASTFAASLHHHQGLSSLTAAARSVARITQYGRKVGRRDEVVGDEGLLLGVRELEWRLRTRNAQGIPRPPPDASSSRLPA